MEPSTARDGARSSGRDSVMFVDRTKRDQGTNLRWRVRLLGLGALLALVGIGTDQPWLINMALGVLILGFGLRFVGRRAEAEPEGGEEPEDSAGAADAEEPDPRA